MRSETYRKYINSMQLRSVQLPEYGFVGARFYMKSISDRAGSIPKGTLIKLESGCIRALVLDPSMYKNRDSMVAAIVKTYEGINADSLKLYALPTVDNATDMVSMAYQEASSLYIYKTWEGTRPAELTGSRKSTPTYSAILASLMNDPKWEGWNKRAIVDVNGLTYSLFCAAHMRSWIKNTLEVHMRKSDFTSTFSKSAVNSAKTLPDAIGVTVRPVAPTAAPKMTVTKDTTPPAVHPIPDGFTVDRVTQKEVMADFKTAAKTLNTPTHGRITKKEAVDQFIRSKRKMLQAIRDHENVVLRVKGVITE